MQFSDLMENGRLRNNFGYPRLELKNVQNIMIHMNNHQIAKIAADNIRILSAAMVEKAKSGHPGGPMGGADFINILYS